MSSLFSRAAAKKKSQVFEPKSYDQQPAATPPIPVGPTGFDFQTPRAPRTSQEPSRSSQEHQTDASGGPLSPQRSIRSVKSVGDTRERRQRDTAESNSSDNARFYRPSSRASNVSDSSQSYYKSNALSNTSMDSHYRDNMNDTVSSRHTMSSSTSSSFAPSIRSVGSSAAASSSYSLASTAGNVTPQPSHTAQMTPARDPRSSTPSSRHSRTSRSSNVPPSPSPSLFSGFDCPRPDSPTEIELLFSEMIERMDLKPPQRDIMLQWHIDKKWQLVHTEKAALYHTSRKGQKVPSAVGYGHASSGSGASAKSGEHVSRFSNLVNPKGKGKSRQDAPEFYLGSFMDNTVDVEIVKDLNVALRTYDVGWLKNFVELQGQSVLATALGNINRSQQWKEPDIVMEHELLKCLKTILNSRAGTEDAIAHPPTVITVVMSLTSPSIPTRKTVLDLLTFLAYYESGNKGHPLVLQGLDTLMAQRSEQSRFDAWFAAFEATIDGRGRMGSLVGASDEVRSLRGKDIKAAMAAAANGQLDSVLSEYALSNILLINGLLQHVEDLDVRIHLRNQMEASGLHRILEKLRAFQHPVLDSNLRIYDEQASYDIAELKENFDQDVLNDIGDPYEVLRAILSSVEGSRAQDFLVSTLKHMLLIRQQGDQRVRYFQLIDQLVTSIVLDRKALDGDFSKVLGTSVADLTSRFADQERLQQALEELASVKVTAQRLRNAKEDLEEEMSNNQGAGSSHLQGQLSRAEQDLQVSRQTTAALESRLVSLERLFKDKENVQELQIQELFTMLKEARMLESVDVDGTNMLDRRELLALMEKKLERTKAFHALEGRNMEADTERKGKSSAGSQASNITRRSAFEDAEDEAVRQHIESRLASEAPQLSPFRGKRHASPQSTRTLPKNNRIITPNSRIPLSQRILDRDEDEDLTPQPKRYQQLADLGVQKQPALTHLNTSNRIPSLPTNLLDQIKAKNAQRLPSPPPDEVEESKSSGRGPSDSGISHMSSQDPLSRPAKSPARESRLRQNTSESSTTSATSGKLAQVVAGPPPPPPPSFIPGPSTSSIAVPTGGPPAPPPPPPAPRAPPIASGASLAPVSTSSLAPSPVITPSSSPGPISPSSPGRIPDFAAQFAKVQLKKVDRSAEETVSYPKGSLVAPKGSTILAPTAPRPPNFPGRPNMPAPQLANLRKDVAVFASQRTNQVFWEAIAQKDLATTVWGQGTLDEVALAEILKSDGIFAEMQEDFKAKQAALQLGKAKKAANLTSVLDGPMRQRIEILLRKHAQTTTADEESEFTAKLVDLSTKLLRCDRELCTEDFLSELRLVLPNATVVGQLSGYRNSGKEVLQTLHKSDRFLVEMLKIERLTPRVEGLLYRSRFFDNATRISANSTRIIDACESLKNAPHFADLLQMALTLGNFLNASGRGGAYGFRVSSLNKFVDTKKAGGKTLLHTLEQVVSLKFPEVEGFEKEIAGAVDCYKLSLEDVRKDFGEIRTAFAATSQELDDNFQDLDQLSPDDHFPKTMIRFLREAVEEIRAIQDKITLAVALFDEVLKLYQENRGSQGTIEFFGIFKTFMISYQRVKKENLAATEEARNLAKRKEAHENRKREMAELKEQAEMAQASGDSSGYDALMVRLREPGRLKSNQQARKARKRNSSLTSPPPSAIAALDEGDVARDMLNKLAAEGGPDAFHFSPPTTPAGYTTTRRSRRTTGSDQPSGTVTPTEQPRTPGNELLLEEEEEES